MSTEQTVQIVGATRPPKEFDPDVENRDKEWKKWKQQFSWYSTCSGLDKQDKKFKVAMFMNALGEKCVDIYNSFDLPDDKVDDYDEIVKKFDEVFGKSGDANLQRHKFFEVSQTSDQKFNDFLVKLRLAAKGCDFGAMENEFLLLQLQKGVHNTKLKEKLLTCKTLDEAKKAALEFELLNERKEQFNVKSESPTVDSMKKQMPSEYIDCNNCGSRHQKKRCKAFGKLCNNCGKPNHYAKMCQSKNQKSGKSYSKHERKKFDHKQPKTEAVTVPEKPNIEKDEGEMYFHLHSLTNTKSAAWFEKLKIKDQIIEFKLDSGSDANVISLKQAEKLKIQLKKSKYKFLLPYGNEKLSVEGQFEAKVKVQATGAEKKLTVLVVDKDVVPILDRESCEALNLVKRINALEINDAIYEGLGCLIDFEYKIEFKEEPKLDIKPIRPIPHKLRDKVKAELDRMESLGVIKWIEEATPVVNSMVIVPKGEGVRICMDPTELNKFIKRRHCKLRNIDEIAANIHGSEFFTKLDLKGGFWQFRIHPESQQYLCMGTPWGRVIFMRGPFGLSSLPEIVQRSISWILKDFENVEVSMDDILIHAKSLEQLEKTTDQVLQRIYQKGLRLNKEKCQFNKKRIRFLGCYISKDGVEADDVKIEAITKLRIPENRKQLSRLLGMVNYLAKYIPNHSVLTEPLRLINSPKVEFIWAEEQQQAFTKIKQVLTSLPVLRLFDVNQPVTVSVDASQNCVGAVLMQNDQPVSYASKSLTACQRNYPQIEKECFAIRFGLTKFHDFVYGNEVTVESDHKPLEAIFKKPLDRAPARLRSLIYDCLMYNPKVMYKPGTQIPIADLLSRDIENDTPTEKDENVNVHLVLKMTHQWKDDLEEATNSDELLKKLKEVIFAGFPNDKKDLPKELNDFWTFRDELSSYEGLIFKGDQVIVPEKYKNKVLSQVHEGHLSATSCINRARQTVFWVGMTADIQKYIDSCETCQKFKKSNTKEPMIVRDVPEYPFQKVSTDLFQYGGKDYVMIVDNYSNWFDFTELKSTVSSEVIKYLKKIFGYFGEPEEVFSDGGPQYSSKEFAEFAQKFNFTHHMSSPHYPKSNGLAERYVQVSKNILKKNPNDIEKALLACRNTPRDNMGSPNQRMLSRSVRTSLPATNNQLKPKVIENVPEKLKEAREKQKDYHDKISRAKPKPKIGEEVLVQHPKTRLWAKAVVTDHDSHPRSVIVKTAEGTYRRNTSFIRKLNESNTKLPIILPPKAKEKEEKSQEKPSYMPVIFKRTIRNMEEEVIESASSGSEEMDEEDEEINEYESSSSSEEGEPSTSATDTAAYSSFGRLMKKVHRFGF